MRGVSAAGYRVIACDIRAGTPASDIFLQFDLRALCAGGPNGKPRSTRFALRLAATV